MAKQEIIIKAGKKNTRQRTINPTVITKKLKKISQKG